MTGTREFHAEEEADWPEPEKGGSSACALLAALILLVMASCAIVAVVLPNFVHNGHGGPGYNESAAIGALRTLNTAQSIYRESGKETLKGAPQYADSLAELSATGTDLIDDVIGGGSKQGFYFRVAADPAGYNWDAAAWAATKNTGTHRFYTNQSGVIYFSDQNPTAPVRLNAGTGNVPAGFKALGG